MTTETLVSNIRALTKPTGNLLGPVTHAIAETAVDFVRQLDPRYLEGVHPVPFDDGRLQLEWTCGRVELEIEFQSISEVMYLKWKGSVFTCEENTHPLTVPPWDALNELVAWVHTD